MILIVDDDLAVSASLRLLLKQAGFTSKTASGPAEAMAVLRSERVSLVFQDMNFSRQTGGEEGLELLRQIRAFDPRLPVILMTAWGSIALAVRGMRAGANDFLTKPWSNEQVLGVLRTTLGLAEVMPKAVGSVPSRSDLEARFDLVGIVGEDPKLLQILDVLTRVAGTDASVLITGEAGTGKEQMAELIHRNGRRRQAPFVKVNLGGISSSLFESEMFGHVRGAFTDARSDRKGRFEMADGGTIFLDEIGDLDLACQVKLLRVLQDRTYESLGSSQPRRVDLRVVSATNRPLAELVERGEFREDLLYRLNLIAVHLPPLRDRPGDVVALARSVLTELGRAEGSEARSLAPGAEAWLAAQPWPGNVRQLKQTIERAHLLTGKSRLEADDLIAATANAAMAARTPLAAPLPPVGEMTLEEMEMAMIEKTLLHHGGNISRAAESLGLTRAALYRRLAKRDEK